MASSHRKKTVGERKTAKSSPPGDGEVKEENAVLRIQASTSGPPRRQRSKGQVANSRPRARINISWVNRSCPRNIQRKAHEPRTPMPRAPREESSDSTHFSAKRQRDRKSQLSSSMRARLGPQEPGRSRPPAATTRAPRPDPMIAPMVQNVPPHRDPMVTPAMRNVHSHLAERPAGRNLPNEPPIGSISKRLDDMLSTPFALISLITNPQGDSSDLSEAFVGQYLCSARHKQNISTLQNIKMRDNESLREFVKRFGQAVLQIEPPTTMDDLFRRANKYSMLEDDVRAATQQVLVAGRASRDNADRHAKPPDRPKPVDRRQDGPSRLSDFRWPRPLETDPSIRDRSKKCAFHKDHGHTTETCRSLQYLVERLIKAGHLKQYLRSDTGGRDVSQHHNSEAPRAPVAPKAVINYINGGPSDEEYDSRRKRQKLLRAASIRERINSIRPGLTGEGPRPIDGTIIFPPVDPTRTLQPHRDALILSLEIGDFDVRRILVDPGSSADLVQASVIGHMGHSLAGLENPGRILSGFNGSSTTSLGDIILPVRAGPVTLNVQFSVVQELSPFNVILGRTWLHYMKAIPSTYHQMVSFLTNEGQTDLYGSQLAARQCYQIAREAVANQEDASPPEPSIARDQ
ncbi:hypothetical protein CK203_080524 [Vitis vinifera]|uniref:Retrotransposon gag domain-containing protein n=1 Tax=Vitis vinifera TaxID=29760 RepID=A0A438E7Q9_VITVI|nr:hypothetical protein CK203_080524 [Vitis vinifera]